MMYTNNCLPQYFFGDATKMSQDEHEQSNKININLSDDVHINVSSIPSPSSSLASTKKLEWDSGADIGYIYDSVKNHRKSKSYPSLNMNMDMDKTNPKDLKERMVSIGEGDTLITKKKPRSFKHSTPIYTKRVIKSCGDSGTLDEVVNKTSKEVQTDDKIQKVENADKSLQTDTLKSSSQTSSSSKSGSFKYIPGSEIASCSTKSNSNSSTSKSSKNKTETSDSGSCSPLGQMISTQHSQNLITDIDKSLAILHKFIKSKNYSNDTKKHYAKKIVTKIINNRYSDDSDSVESPVVKSPQNKEFVDCGVQCNEIERKSQILSEKSSCQIKQSLDKLNALQVDLKNWRDAQTLSEKLFEARKNKIKTPEIDTTSDEKEKDYLVRHSKNERKRQISWINNEISYLQKLKDLLQINHNTSNTSSLITSSTTTSKKSVVENIDDIEKRFNEEFGLPSSSVTLKDSQNKLSKYLSNEQIKSIVESTDKNTYKKDSSFNSHKNSIYADKTAKIVDAATQYSFHEKETPLIVNVKDTTPLNVVNLEPTSPTSVGESSRSSCYESLIIEQHVPVKIKPNIPKINVNPPKIKPNNHKLDKKLSTAYFLTFEEESLNDAADDEDERKSLEHVVVKIPKPRPVLANSVNVKNKGCSRTLEEYLIRNRPHFVENANWRWAQVNQQSVFSCFEMKEMTRRKYNKLPEIQEKKEKYRTLVERTNNRFKADMFSRKLQKKTLQGHICLATCKRVMASD